MCCHRSKCYKRKKVSKCWFTSTWCRWFFECSVIINTFNMNVSVLTVVQEVKTTANIITFMRINIKTKESLFYFVPNWLNYYIIRNYERIYIYIDYYFFHYHDCFIDKRLLQLLLWNHDNALMMFKKFCRGYKVIYNFQIHL